MFVPTLNRYSKSAGLGYTYGGSNTNYNTSKSDGGSELDNINKELSSYPKAAPGSIWCIDPNHPFGGKAYVKANEASIAWVTVTTGTTGITGDFLGGETAGAMAATGIIPGTAKKYHDYRVGIASTNEMNLYLKIKEVEDIYKQIDAIMAAGTPAAYKQLALSPLYTKLNQLRTLDSLKAERTLNVNTRLRLQAWLIGLSAEIANVEKTAKANIDYYNSLVDAVSKAETERLNKIAADAETERKRLEKLADDAEAKRQAELAEQYRIEAEGQRLLKEEADAEAERQRLLKEEADALDREQKKLADEAKVKSDTNFQYMMIGGGILLLAGYFLFFKKK